MSNITTKILYESEITELDKDFHALTDLDTTLPVFKDWHYTHPHSLGYENIKKLSIIFIGQTGYGKSSLINKLIDKEIFETSDFQSCTKVLQSANYFLNHNKKHERIAHILSFVDLPGIGENDKEDEKYLRWYQDYIREASIIVYLFRADKRDHTQDEFFFNNVFNPELCKHLICVISQADKIEPLSRSFGLSEEQKRNIKLKESQVKQKPFLNFSNISVTHVSSYLDINIDNLRKSITQKISLLASM